MQSINIINEHYVPSTTNIAALIKKTKENEIKQKKTDDLDNLKINYTIDGIEYPFEVDDISRSRMSDAIDAANFTSETSTQWKTADNRLVTVNVFQLTTIRALGIKKLGSIILDK